MMRDSRHRSPEGSKRRKRDKKESRDERGSREKLTQVPPAPMSSSSYQDLLQQQQQATRAAGPSSDATRTRGDFDLRTPRHQRRRARSGSASSSGGSTSPSLLDISRHHPTRTRFGGIFGTFFRAPSERRVRRRRSGRAQKAGARALYFGNSSSSSVNSDLAYGHGYIPRRRSRDLNERSASRGQGRRNREQRASSGYGGAAAAAAVGAAGFAGAYGASRSRLDGPQRAKTDEEILEIGRQLSDIAKRQNEHDLRSAGKIKTSGLMAAAAAVNEVRRKRRHDSKSRGIGSSRPHGGYSSDGSDWEDASDDEGYSDGAESALAYGSVVSQAPRPPKLSSVGAAAGAAVAGAGLASMAGQRPSGSFAASDSRKSSVVDPRLFGPQNSLRGMINTPCGFGDDKQGTEEHLRFNKLRRAETEPIFSGSRRDEADLPYRSRPAPIPLQQPSPKAPVSSKVYQAERLEEDGLRDSNASRRRSGEAGGNAAITLGGVAAAAAAAAALASGRRQKREERRRERNEAATGSGKRDGESELDRERRRHNRDSYSSKYPDSKDDHKRSSRHVDNEAPRKRRETVADHRPDPDTGASKSSRRDSRRVEDRDERRDRDLFIAGKPGYGKTKDRGGSTFVAGNAPIDPFQFQVADGVIGASLGAAAAGGVPDRPLTPTVVTVDREPNFDDLSAYEPPSGSSRLSRKDSFELEREAESRRSGDATGSKKAIGARQSHDYEENEHEARNIYEEARHATAPIAAAAMASAVAVEMQRSRDLHRDDYSEDGSRDASKSGRDPVQEEADRYYREVKVAHRIAAEEQHSRSQSPERSVVHKYDDDDDRDKAASYQIVTPPEMEEKNDGESRFAGPDADVRIDNKIFPDDLHRFRAAGRTSGKAPLFNSRDPSCERDRPVLNLVYPTPVPSRQATPAPKQEDTREVAEESEVASKGKDKSKSKSKDKDKKKKKGKDDGQEQQVTRETPQPTDPTASSKSVTWGENSTKSFEVESPEPSRDIDAPRPRVTASSQWGILAAAIAGSSTEPANEPDSTKPVSSRKAASDGANARNMSGVDDTHGDRPPVPGPKPASPTSNKMPGGFADDIEFAATLAAGLKDTGFDPNIVIDDPNYRRRDSPPRSSESNGDAWSNKSFSDVVTDMTAKSKSVSASGDSGSRDGPSVAEDDEWAEVPKKLSKKDKKKLEKAARRQSVEAGAEEGTPLPDVPEQPLDDATAESKLSKKELRKLDKQAKKDAETASDDKDLPRNVDDDDVWEETTKKKSKKNRKSRDLEDDSSSKVSVPTDAFDDLKQLRREDPVEDEWETSSKKSKKKSKRDSTGSEVASRSAAASEFDADSGSRRSSKSSKRRSGADFGDYGDDPPDKGHDPFDDRDVTSVVSESRGDERRKERRSKRSSGNDDDKDDDAKSIASMPASSSRSKESDKKEKRSSGIFSGFFKGSSKEEPKEPALSNEKEKDSFLDNAGTLGAGVGFATAAAAVAASVSRSRADQLNEPDDSDRTNDENKDRARDRDRSYDDVHAHVDVDPEIAPRAIKPAIDPQYGDLLPLPPSEPGSPSVGPEDDLPALPDSRPDTPPEERNLRRGYVSHRRRRSLQDPPIKSPSRTAIPISLRLGTRGGGTPTSPGTYRSPPSSSPIGTPESVSRRQVRHTSWDSSREIKPLYLLEHSRQTSVDSVPLQDQLPALPASETSSSESQVAGHEGEQITDPGIDARDLASAGLRINTGLASAAASEDIAGSQETTPRANSQPQFPSLAEAIDPSADFANPDPVDSMSKDRSSYLLNSTPSSTRSNKTAPSEGGAISPVDSTPSKKLGVESNLPDIAEDFVSADEQYASALEGESEDRWEEAEDWGSSSKHHESDVQTRDVPADEPAKAAPINEDSEPEEWKFMTAKEKKKAKKARKNKELALAGAAVVGATSAAIVAPALIDEPTPATTSDNQVIAPEDEFQVSKKGKKAKKGKKKSLPLAWDEDLGETQPTESSTDKDVTVSDAAELGEVAEPYAATKSRDATVEGSLEHPSKISEKCYESDDAKASSSEVVNAPGKDKQSEDTAGEPATIDPGEGPGDAASWALPVKKSKKKKSKSKDALSWDLEEPGNDDTKAMQIEDASIETKPPTEPAAEDMWSVPLSKKDKKKKKKKGLTTDLEEPMSQEQLEEQYAASKDTGATSEVPVPTEPDALLEEPVLASKDDTASRKDPLPELPKEEPIEEFAVVSKGKKGKKSKRKSVQFDESSLSTSESRDIGTGDAPITEVPRSLESQVSEPLFSQPDDILETTQDTYLTEEPSQVEEVEGADLLRTWDDAATSDKSKKGGSKGSSNVWDLLEDEPSTATERSAAAEDPPSTEHPDGEDEWSLAVSGKGSQRKSSLSALLDPSQEYATESMTEDVKPAPENFTSTSRDISLDAPRQETIGGQSEDEWATAVSSKKSKRKQRDSLIEAFPEPAPESTPIPVGGEDQPVARQEPSSVDSATVDAEAEFEVPKKSQKDKKKDKKQKGSNVWDALEEGAVATSTTDTPDKAVLDDTRDFLAPKHLESAETNTTTPIEPATQDTDDSALSKDADTAEVTPVGQDASAEPDDWAFPVKLSKKDKKKKKKQAALEESLGEEPSSAASPADDGARVKTEREIIVDDPSTSEAVETVEPEAAKSLDADHPDDTWGFSVKKSKKGKKGKKTKDVESELPQEPEPTSQLAGTPAESQSTHDLHDVPSVLEDSKAVDREDQEHREPSAGKGHDDEDDDYWALGLSRKEKKKRQKAKTLDLAAALDPPSLADSDTKKVEEAGDDNWAETISKKDKKKGKKSAQESADDLYQDPDLLERGNVDPEVMSEQAQIDRSPAEPLKSEPLEEQSSTPLLDEVPVEDEWSITTSGKSKKAKKAQKQELQSISTKESTEPPPDLPELHQDSLEDGNSSARRDLDQSTEQTEHIGAREDAPIASDQPEAAAEDTWEVPQRKLSKKEKKKQQKQQQSTFELDEPSTESTPAEAEDGTDKPEIVDEFTAEPDEWQAPLSKKEKKKQQKKKQSTFDLEEAVAEPSPPVAEEDTANRATIADTYTEEPDEWQPPMNKKEKKKAAKLAAAAAAAASATAAMTLTSASARDDNVLAESEPKEALQETAPVDELPRFGGGGSWADEMDEVDPIVSPEPKNLDDSAHPTSTEQDAQPGFATTVAEDEWAIPSKKKGKKGKKSKSSSGIATPVNEPAPGAAAEADAAAADIDNQAAAVPAAPADQPDVPEAAADDDDDWGFTVKKTGKKGKKTKKTSGLVTPAAEPELSADRTTDDAMAIAATATDESLAEPNLSRQGDPQSEAFTSTEAPQNVGADDDWGFTVKKKGKKGKKSKTSSGVMTPVTEPDFADGALDESMPTTAKTGEQPPVEPGSEEPRVSDTAEALPWEAPPQVEPEDYWGFTVQKKGKKGKKSKSGSGAVTPTTTGMVPSTGEMVDAMPSTTPAEENISAKSISDTREIIEPAETLPMELDAPRQIDADDNDWGFTVTTKGKKAKKSKPGSGSMTTTGDVEYPADRGVVETSRATVAEPSSDVHEYIESVDAAPTGPDAPKQVDADDEWGFTVKKKGKKDKKRKSSLATAVDAPPPTQEQQPLQTQEQQLKDDDALPREASDYVDIADNDQPDPSTTEELATAGAVAGGVAMLAERFGGAGKKKKSKGKKKELDKREQREPDMFDDPALWEGAEKKGVEGGRDADLHDDFWGGGPGSDRGEENRTVDEEPASLLRRVGKVDEPIGGLLHEMADAEPMTPVREEPRQSPTRSLPAVAEVPEMENEAEAQTPRANRDSGFATGSPPQRRRDVTAHDEEQRDSGVHTGDWVDDDKGLAHARSPFTGPTLREPDEAPATPEPEKKRKSKLAKKTYGDVGAAGAIGGAAAFAGAAALARPDDDNGDDDEHYGRRIVSDSRGPYNRGGPPERESKYTSFGDGDRDRDGAGGPGPSGWPRADPVPRRVASNTSLSRRRTPEPLRMRPESPGSRATGRATPTPPLRRVDKRMSGDLRALRQQTSSSTLSQSQPQPVANESRVRSSRDSPKDGDMADVYDGFGEGRMGSPRSPTRPHSMRRRQSMQVLELESRVDQLLAENRLLTEARSHAEQNLSQRATGALSERDAEIESLKQSLHFLQNEVARLTEVNEGLTSANAELATRDGAHDANNSGGSRGLGEAALAAAAGAGVGGLGTHASMSRSLEDKDAEIAELRAQLDEAKEQVRQMQLQILESKAGDSDFLSLKDEDYFDHRCQQLCSHVQQWVLRFSKFSDMRACRLTSEINDEKTIDRLDNAVLDGSDVDVYLRDRVRRRDVFMSMTMNMIWEFVFTRYLFGMDREQRQKLKSLEKLLSEVGPAHAVRQWRAVTLTLLSRRDSFRDQRDLDTEAVVQAIIQTLCKILPPPSNLEGQIHSQLRRVMQEAVDLSIEMRTQRAEYMMLPPLQPEYDADGELAATVSFDAAMMNERGSSSSGGGGGQSNEELEEQGAVVRVVLFPLVVKRGDDQGVGEDKIVVCPAQVLIARDDHRRSSRHVTPMSDAGDVSMGGGPSRISVATEAMSVQPEAQYIEGGI